ncbi:MlaD family protein [Desulfobotulus sp. H1]|uniref:MlaD family protein n=1 Tax=Desulfobotulus pelophilus TaxID=2823377 RepID=A0ABT3N964_9BACT|nr:MlaD family protein [Desulfobotulus pelophilus]MCW7753975.1 MlaD family protein [Desulfobotulus pelophilus]
MDLEFSRRERVVGTFVVAILILLLSTLFILGRGKGWFERHISYYTIFAESYNLQRGAEVKLYNTNVGRVRRVTVTGEHVRVDLDILETYASRIREDTIATVESPTLIGSEFVSIRTPGRSDAPLIPQGGEIFSQERKSITDLLSEFEIEKTAKMVIAAVQDLSEMAGELGRSDGPVFTALHTINLILTDIQEGRGTLGSFLKSRELMDEVNARMAEISAILIHVEEAAGKAPRSVDLVNENLEQVAVMGAAVGRAVDEVLEALQKELDKVSRIVDDMERAGRDVPSITRSTRSGIQEVRETLRELDKVVTSVQKNVLIRGHIPPEPAGEALDADAR